MGVHVIEGNLLPKQIEASLDLRCPHEPSLGFGPTLAYADVVEKMLLATQSAIRPDKVLLCGMGPVSEYSIKVLKREIYGAGLSLRKINVSEFGIHIPKVEGFERYYGLHIETAVKFFSKLYLKEYKDLPEYILKVLFSVDKNDIPILEKTAEKLRKYFSPLSDCSILVEKETRQDNKIPGLAA